MATRQDPPPQTPRRQGRRRGGRESDELLLAGDVMTARGMDQVLAHPGAPTLFEHWVRDARDYVRLAEQAHGPIPSPVAPDYFWGEALAQMARHPDAVRIANLETAVTAGGAPWPGKGIHYRMHPANIDCLRAARLDGCSLANNHVLDWGHVGLADTLAALAAAGIASAGAGVDVDAATRPQVRQLLRRHRFRVPGRVGPDRPARQRPPVRRPGDRERGFPDDDHLGPRPDHHLRELRAGGLHRRE
ncbi:MAG TPA: CapA family protein [Ramlibacter sp.]|nr:CapA family protein [Ramlibacter sp.]